MAPISKENEQPTFGNVGIIRRELAPEDVGASLMHRSKVGTCRKPEVSEGGHFIPQTLKGFAPPSGGIPTGAVEFPIQRSRAGILQFPTDKHKMSLSNLSFLGLISILFILLFAHIPTFFCDSVDGAKGDAPFLTWTGEDGYITDGLEPDSGLTTDGFEFRVMYVDTEGEDPTDPGNYIRLVLDDESYNMTSVDHEYSDGSIFNITFHDLTPGSHTYYFEVMIREITYRLPKTGNIEEPFVNTKPTLTTPTIHGGAFHESTVYPLTGNNTDTFTFQIVYSDADNHKPADADLPVGVFIDNVYNKMEYMKELGTAVGDYYDGDFTNGELYQFSIKLEKGEHQHSFQFTDEAGETVISGPFRGPIVITGFADLLVKMNGDVPDIRWQTESTDLEDWGNVTILSTIENDGGTDIDVTFPVNVTVYLFNYLSGEAEIKAERVFPVDGLAVGEEYIISMEYTPPIMGLYEVWITLDRYNDVAELVEYNIDEDLSNNIRKARFKAGPDLSISASDISPPTTYDKNTFIPAVVIHNSGSTDAVLKSNIEVSFTVSGLEPIQIFIPKGLTIGCGRTHNIGCDPLYLDVEDDVEEVTVSVKIDPSNSFQEAINHNTYFDNNYAEAKVMVARRVYKTDSPSFDPPLTLICLSLLLVSVISMKYGRSTRD